MRKRTWLIDAALLVIFIAISLYFRIYLPYDDVFTSLGVKFSSVDAYWHMRIVDTLVYNFPHLIAFDPYAIFPGGGPVFRIHFFDWLLAGIIWLSSLGSPTDGLIDTIGAYFPAILGALILVPTYFIARAVFSRWAGLIAAGLVAVLPGEFLGRSILGFTDHHVAETLFSTVAMLFLMLAVKAGGEKKITFSHVKERNWVALKRPLVISALAGISFALYMLTWGGSLLFVFIIASYLAVQSVANHLRSKPSDYLAIIGAVFFVVAALIAVPITGDSLYRVALLGAALGAALLGVISRAVNDRGWPQAYYPASLVGIGLVAAMLLKLATPELFASVADKFSLFAPTGASAKTTLEMQGILFPNGQFSWQIAWGNYNIAFFISILVIVILAVYWLKESQPELGLLLAWSVIIFVATWGQRRFGYYLAVNIALLSAVAFWFVLRFAGSRITKIIRESRDRRTMALAAKGKRASRQSRTPAGRLAAGGLIGLAGLVTLGSTLAWDIRAARDLGMAAAFAPSDAWYQALSWMKQNTPEPFGDPAFYYKEYNHPRYDKFDYPPTAYGVAAWWDYGYWITRMAHRIPSANPGQDPERIRDMARLFMSQNETSAVDVVQKIQASYIIIDYKTVSSIFWAIAEWNGQNQSDYSDVYFTRQPGESRLQPVMLYYPEYYRSMAVRLYSFDARPVADPQPVVVTYRDSVAPNGMRYKQVNEARSFPTSAAAQAYADDQNRKGNKARMVSSNPFISPVPLEGLKDFRLAYGSPSSVGVSDRAAVPEVKVFEYVGGSLAGK